MTFNCQGVHVWQFSLQNWQQELIKTGTNRREERVHQRLFGNKQLARSTSDLASHVTFQNTTKLFFSRHSELLIIINSHFLALADCLLQVLN